MNVISRFVNFVAESFSGFFDKRLWTPSQGYSRSTSAKVDVSEDTALNYSAVWCATRLLCGTGASLPFPVYSGRDDDTRVKERSHPVHRLLNVSPNPEMSAYNFRSVMWQWQVNWGNAYAEIIREGNNPDGQIVELWPIHPSRVRMVRDQDGTLLYEVKNEGGVDASYLETWEVLHVSSIITYDGILGQGVIGHAKETIGAGIAAEKHAANWFGGAAVPMVVIEHDGKWDDTARSAFRKEWKEIYGGPEGDEVALLQGGAKAKPLGFSPQDSQFLESRQFDIEEIARWYGIPPHLLQHLLRATFNNIEELGIDFVRYGLNLWLKVWEQEVCRKLFNEDERQTMFAEHNVDALLRGNASARAAFYQAMINAAIMTRNECRKLENLDPVDGGDTFLVQGATVPLDEEGKPESDFAGGGAAAKTSDTSADNTDNKQGDSSEPTKPQTDAPEEIKAVVAYLDDVVVESFERMLTKESKRILEYAAKSDNFVKSVDEFYTAHAALISDVVSRAAMAYQGCGYQCAVDGFVHAWIDSGIRPVIDATGNTGPDKLVDTIQRVFESKTWKERPLRTVEGMKNATLVV